MEQMFKKLKNISLDDWRFMLEYGIPSRRVSIFDLRNGLLETMEPVFFLSTGRAGTMWFSELIKQDKSVKVLHHPKPDFAVQNAKAYKLYQLKGLKENIIDEWLAEIFLAGRENHLTYSYKTDRRLIETNNAITFFAYALANLFPRAKFIHLLRPPRKFIASGMKRGYYSDHPQEIRRIVPNENENSWVEFSREEKIAWLWTETNTFIREFGEQVGEQRFRKFYFNDISVEGVSSVLDFISVDYHVNALKKQIKKPVNVQKQKSEDKMVIDWDKAGKIYQHEAKNLNIKIE
jgi:hypothetical protein